MDKSPDTAEAVFAEAIELLPGSGRDRWLAERCGDDTALHCEVASLLRAHDNAGHFLVAPPVQPTVRAKLAASATQAIGAVDAAAHADVFLRDLSLSENTHVEDFVAHLPEAVRVEARERIMAGLHVRRLQDQERRPPSDQETELPRLPGFRLERRLGEAAWVLFISRMTRNLTAAWRLKFCVATRMHWCAAACWTKRATSPRWAIRPS